MQGHEANKPQSLRIQVHGARRQEATASGFGSLGWHTFRHTYCAVLSESSTDLEVQQKLSDMLISGPLWGVGEVSMENKRSANSNVVRATLLHKSAR
jgi:integrase